MLHKFYSEKVIGVLTWSMRDITRFVDSSDYFEENHSKRMLRFRSEKSSLRFRTKRLPFSLPSLLDSSLRSVAIAVIGVYQHHISPEKGYSCSHRIVYGGDSCSEYVKKTLTDKSLFEATLLARRRFRECNTACTSSKNRVVKSNSSVMVSVGPDTDIIQLIIGAIVALLALIFGIINGCCKK